MNCLPVVNTWVHPQFVVGSVLLIFLFFCVVFLTLFVFVLCFCAQCFQCILIFHSWFPPTFYILSQTNRNRVTAMVPKTSLVFYLIYLTFVLICNQHYYSKESREPLCYSHVLILYLNTAIHTHGQLRSYLLISH